MANNYKSYTFLIYHGRRQNTLFATQSIQCDKVEAVLEVLRAKFQRVDGWNISIAGVVAGRVDSLPRDYFDKEGTNE